MKWSSGSKKVKIVVLEAWPQPTSVAEPVIFANETTLMLRIRDMIEPRWRLWRAIPPRGSAAGYAH